LSGSDFSGAKLQKFFRAPVDCDNLDGDLATKRFMTRQRFENLFSRYAKLRVAVVGDFCLDRYLEIDPRKKEISIETGLRVHNVVNVRSQPGGAGTILNNLAALGVGTIFPVGFCGMDGEGYELRRALEARPCVSLEYFFATPLRRTFTYCKPLLVERAKTPIELNRLDSKNWTITPAPVQERIAKTIQSLSRKVDAIILLDQVDLAETGVVTRRVLQATSAVAKARPRLLLLADSRRGLKHFPPAIFKMNRAELARLLGVPKQLGLEALKKQAASLARRSKRPVFVSLSEQGILGASPKGEVEWVPALPVRGEIDIVGAGDAVTANLTAALAAGASLRESLEISNAAASIVIHQLGTTGVATPNDIARLLK
jgi:rfaE bifunctional protein kinase chain/domain